MRVLLTGPTGLVGSAILRSLVSRGHRVLAVSRGRAGRTATERLRSLLESLGLDSLESSLEVHDGDEGVPLAGWLLERDAPDAVVHAAGSVKFTQDLAALRRENPEATARLLDTLDAAAPEAAFHFIGTAYTCGRRRGTVLESDRGAGLSPYEASKLEAEEIVRERCSGRARPWTVLRPSIVGGDWRDGSAASFNGLGQFLRAIDVAGGEGGSRPGAPLRIQCDPAATKNIVPSDWVAAIVVAVAERRLSGATLHLTHPAPPTAAEILPMLREAAGIDGIEIAGTPAIGPIHPLQGLLDRMLASFSPYFAGECSFDRRGLERALPDLPPPPPIEPGYLRRLIGFGRSTGWLSRPLEDGAWRSGLAPHPAARRHGKEEPCATS